MRLFSLFAVFGAFLYAPICFDPAMSHAESVKLQPSEAEPTRIEVDSESAEIKFFVKDELAAVLKEDGFHVRNDMSYGGAITDYGISGFDDFGGGAYTATNADKDGSDAQ